MEFSEKTNFKAGLKGFEILYFDLCRKQFLRSLRYSSVFTFLMVIIALISSKEWLHFIKVIINIGLNITPDILGFTIAGYAMIVGLSNTNAMNTLKESQTDEGISMFQLLNTTFIAMLLSALLNLLFCIIAKVVIEAEIESPLCTWMIDMFNGISFLVLMMSTFYVVFSIKDLLSNLFSLGQFLQLIK
jgi:hypothetical protein